MSRSSESSRSVEAPRTPEISHSINGLAVKERKESRDSKSSDKKSNKAWYKMLNPTYKSRSEDLKRLFKDLPSDERLIVGLYLISLIVSVLILSRCSSFSPLYTTEGTEVMKLSKCICMDVQTYIASYDSFLFAF